MNSKTFKMLLALEAILCTALAFILPTQVGTSGYMTLAQFPFALIGQALRGLSLSGSLGNSFAIILYALVCILPAAYAVLRIIKKKFRTEDSLLFVSSGYSFYMLYCMINPAFIGVVELINDNSMGKAVLGGIFYSILIGYVILRLLKKTEIAKTEKLLGFLKLILGAMAVAAVFFICYAGITNVRSEFTAIQASNTDPAVSLDATYMFIIIRFALSNLPGIFEITLFIMAMQLCKLMILDRYSEDTITSAEKMAGYSKKVVIAIIISYICLNLLQALFLKTLLSTKFNTVIPLSDIALVFVIFLTARFFADTRRLKRENDMFI